MPDLKTTREELLSLYPRETERLDVVIAVNTPFHLNALYIQRDTPDELRNWEIYDKWKNKKLGKTILGLPKEFAWIYEESIDLFNNGKINLDDKILIEFQIYSGSRCGEMSDVIAQWEGIHRNPDEGLRGLGAEVHYNIAGFLRERGFRYITIKPIPKRRKYAESLGFIKISSLKEESWKLFNPNPQAPPTHIYFLGDDLAEHLKK